MNIIAGLARGVELRVPPGIPVRPTTGRVRKALFDSLGDLSDCHVLDLFSGSGALALESLSRVFSRVFGVFLLFFYPFFDFLSLYF